MAGSSFNGPGEHDQSRPQLDGPPPLPPGGEGRKVSALEMQSRGLGEQSSNPQVATIQGMQQFERGAQVLAQFLPQLQAPLGQMLAFVRQAVPQLMMGGNPMQVPANQPPQGGMMGGGPPPPPPPGPQGMPPGGGGGQMMM